MTVAHRAVLSWSPERSTCFSSAVVRCCRLFPKARYSGPAGPTCDQTECNKYLHRYDETYDFSHIYKLKQRTRNVLTGQIPPATTTPWSWTTIV